MFKHVQQRKSAHKPSLSSKDERSGTQNAQQGEGAGVPRYLQTESAASGSSGADEHEADRIADQVVGPSSQSARVRRSAVLPEVPAKAPESVRQTVGQPGQALDTPTRARMESGLGFDFQHVRIHRDGRAAQSAQDLGARAYAVGRDVVFGANEYAPATREGQHLLAHELAHVVQQHGRVPVIQKQALPGVAEAERHALIVSSRVDEISDAWIRERFLVPAGGGEPTSRRSPGSDVTVRFAPPLDTEPPDNIRIGLTSVAAHELLEVTAGGRNGGPTYHPLAVGRTLELNLALSPYGGEDGRYRFTHTARDGGSEILIELVGAIPADAPPEPIPGGGRFTVGGSSFELVGAWGNAEDFALLQEAIGLLPPASLAAADGLKFLRMTGSAIGGEDGRYRPSADTVELFAETFHAARRPGGHTPERTTVGGRRAGVWTIVHEIGHALDLRPLAPAWSQFEQAQRAFNRAVEEYNGLIEDVLGDASPGQIEAASQRMQAAQHVMEEARTRLTQARSQSGRRWALEDPTNPDSSYAEQEGDLAHPSAFQQAATQDGIAPDTRGRRTPEGTAASLSGGTTSYADTDWGELYAESFALYTLDPELLERTRPHVYAYFSRLYPHAPPADSPTP